MALKILDRPSPNFDARARGIDLVVLHYTGMQDFGSALRRLTDPAPVAGAYPGPWQGANVQPDAPLPRVSCHYVLDQDGTIYRLVADTERAWHAGASSWEGEGDVNSRALGVEIVNGGHDFGLPDFPPAQIDALILLLKNLLARWNLKPRRVVGHSDVAPARKYDPGEKFPWRALAEAGVSIWPGQAPDEAPADDPIGRAQERLAAFGYGLSVSGAMDPPTKAVLAAFQRRFRPARVDGALDEETAKLLAALSP